MGKILRDFLDRQARWVRSSVVEAIAIRDLEQRLEAAGLTERIETGLIYVDLTIWSDDPPSGSLRVHLIARDEEGKPEEDVLRDMRESIRKALGISVMERDLDKFSGRVSWKAKASLLGSGFPEFPITIFGGNGKCRITPIKEMREVTRYEIDCGPEEEADSAENPVEMAGAQA